MTTFTLDARVMFQVISTATHSSLTPIGAETTVDKRKFWLISKELHQSKNAINQYCSNQGNPPPIYRL